MPALYPPPFMPMPAPEKKDAPPAKKAVATAVPPLVIRQPVPGKSNALPDPATLDDAALEKMALKMSEQSLTWAFGTSMLTLVGSLLAGGAIGMMLLGGIAVFPMAVALAALVSVPYTNNVLKWGRGKRLDAIATRFANELNRRGALRQNKMDADKADAALQQRHSGVHFALLLRGVDDAREEAEVAERAGDTARALDAMKTLARHQEKLAAVKAALGSEADEIEQFYRRSRSHAENKAAASPHKLG